MWLSIVDSKRFEFPLKLLCGVRYSLSTVLAQCSICLSRDIETCQFRLSIWFCLPLLSSFCDASRKDDLNDYHEATPFIFPNLCLIPP
jgi:hypothetical protein